jgi:YD repeat-containing protein
LVEKINAGNVSIQKLIYDDDDKQTESKDAENKLTEFSYDKNNRLISTKNPLLQTTSQTYDVAGNISSKTDGNSNITKFAYDEYNRLVCVENAKAEKTIYTYDAATGNLLTQADGENNVTTYEYNAANKIITKIDNGGRSGIPGAYIYTTARVERYTYYPDVEMPI